MATNFEFLFVSWIANLTEGHLPTGNRVANANFVILGSLIIPLLLKIPRLNIFSEELRRRMCSKSGQFSSRPLFTRSPRKQRNEVAKSIRRRPKIRRNWLSLSWNTCVVKWRGSLGRFARLCKEKKAVAFRVGECAPDSLAHNPLGGYVNRREQIKGFRREKIS